MLPAVVVAGIPAAEATGTEWKPIGISNSTWATYDVAYDWSVDKSVDEVQKTVAAGTTATFTYRVLLTAKAEQRSGHLIRGRVRLTNRNVASMVATLSATATTGTGCTFTGATDVSADEGLQVDVPEGASIWPYVCTPSMPAMDGTTTATVSWDSEDYPSGTEGSDYSDSETGSYAFMLDDSTDEQTTVTDTFNAGTPEVLGTFIWADVWNETDATTPEHTVVVKTYTRTITAGAAGTCASYPNTATSMENDTGQTTTSQETVTVCSPAAVVGPPPPPAPGPVVPPVPPVPPVDVAPAEAAGSMGGGLRGTCQGTLRVRMRNGFDDAVRFTLTIGGKATHHMVRADSTRRMRTTAPGGARVVLRAKGRVIDRMRMPARCNPPAVLPATGLRATTTR